MYIVRRVSSKHSYRYFSVIGEKARGVSIVTFFSDQGCETRSADVAYFLVINDAAAVEWQTLS